LCHYGRSIDKKITTAVDHGNQETALERYDKVKDMVCGLTKNCHVESIFGIKLVKYI